ncbi:MAG: citrate/2-methylcitrate synthase [Sandaracinaceae bacterium]
MNQPNGIDDPDDAWVSAAEASALLGVKRETLYAYVSRGRVRSRSQGGRRRAYHRGDLGRLKAQTDARAGHGAVAAGALLWGEPVLDSAITRIDPTGPAYRGHVAVDLAERGVAFERVAELLLGGALPDEAAWTDRLPLAPTRTLASLVSADARPVDAALLALPAFAMRDPARFDVGPDAELRVARRIVRGARRGARRDGLGGSPARGGGGEPTIARSVARALGVRPTRRHLEERSTARWSSAPTTGSTPRASPRASPRRRASLRVHERGARHAHREPARGLSERVSALADEVGAPERATRVVRDRLRRGDAIPGFGHPLYPDGDPRAALLVDTARALAPRNPRVRILSALVDTLELVGGDRPTLDVGLVALAASLGLPDGGATAIFAAGRSAGWLAHAIEQRAAGHLLRPRARYVGPDSGGLSPVG